MWQDRIPLSDIRVGDHFYAFLRPDSLSRKNGLRRSCELVEICGSIWRVRTRSRKGLVAIMPSQVYGTGWGERP